MLSIEVKNLVKKFKDTIAINNISFEIEKGICFALLGPNGAGKTTTINILSTLLTPTDGLALVAGYNVLTQKNEVRKNIGIVFQEPALDSKLTGRENLEFHSMMYGIPREIYTKKIDYLLELVELKEKENVLVRNYSGGMKRRLEIARGLIHEPKVLFLDEPTLGLDTQTRRLIWDYIKKLNTEYKITLLLTTHYMEEADYLCDKIAIIDHGKILVNDTPSNLKSKCGENATLEDVFIKYTGSTIRNIEEKEKIW